MNIHIHTNALYLPEPQVRSSLGGGEHILSDEKKEPTKTPPNSLPQMVQFMLN